MQDIYERLIAGGEAALQSLVDNRAVETVTLDFKRKEAAGHGAFDKGDKATLGELLSGFANSSGGLAVWGVDSRKGDDGVDCAQGLHAIDDIALFDSQAQSLCGSLLQPRHDGIKLAVIRSETKPGAGYLMVLVERSERRPHRCEAPGKKQYFKRAGDSFFAMEHYDIEDAFRRIDAPSVRVLYRTDRKPKTIKGHIGFSIDVTLAIENSSSHACRFPYLRVLRGDGISAPSAFTRGTTTSLVTTPDTDGWLSFCGGSDAVLHPGRIMPVAQFTTDYVMDSFGRPEMARRPDGTFSIEVRAGGLNAREIRRDLTLGWAFLEKPPTEWVEIKTLPGTAT